jgi:putative hydrolase of the HAD superfamily
VIKAIIFDCFGVIVGKGFPQTYRMAGGDPKNDRDFIVDLLGQANLGMITDDLFNLSISNHLGISVQTWNEVVKRAELPDNHLLNYIKELRKSYKTAVLSNSNRGVLARKIGDSWLSSCFDEVIVSAEVGIVKPDPRIYKIAAERLNVEMSECVFIDDQQTFIETGRGLGMKVILYKDFIDFKHELEKLIG